MEVLAGEKRAVTGYCLAVGIWKRFRLGRSDRFSNPFQGLVFTAFHAAFALPAPASRSAYAVLGTTGTEKVGS